MKQRRDGIWFACVKSEKGDYNKWSTKKSSKESEMKLAAFDCLTRVLAEQETQKPAAGRRKELPEKLPEPVTMKLQKQEAEPEVKPEVKSLPQPQAAVQHDLFEAEPHFTNEQKSIFEFIKSGTGHGIIDAVAGAGKTTTIMECAKHVPDKNEVLFCAFNKSIQTEIAAKFSKQGMNAVTVKTIHALGYQILNDNNKSGKRVTPQESKYRTVLNSDTGIQKEIQLYLEEILALNGFRLNETETNRQFAIKDIIYNFKDRLLDMNQKIRATLTPDDFKKFKHLAEHFNFFTEAEIAAKSFERELEIYFECGKLLLGAGNLLAEEAMIIDYTDMLYLPYLWDLRASRTYSFLFIDECQDLSKSQLAVVLKYGQKGGRILAVGDPYQSIYGFAGADIESFNRIKTTIKANALPLTTCFRCPPNIVTLAASIRHDMKANKREHGIIEEISFKEVVKKARAQDLIISRYREPVIFLIFDFINKNRQVQIHRDEVDDIINELKNLFKQEERSVVITEMADGFEALKEAVFNRWSFIIEKESRKLANSSERSMYIQVKTEYLNNRLEFLHKKYVQWKNSCRTINDMLLKIKEFISAADNCVKLSTIHRAKGLEAERVFVLNFDELPHFKPSHKPWERTQEKNLKYVAITRACRELYQVRAEKIDDIKKDASLFDEFMIDD